MEQSRAFAVATLQLRAQLAWHGPSSAPARWHCRLPQVRLNASLFRRNFQFLPRIGDQCEFPSSSSNRSGATGKFEPSCPSLPRPNQALSAPTTPGAQEQERAAASSAPPPPGPTTVARRRWAARLRRGGRAGVSRIWRRARHMDATGAPLGPGAHLEESSGMDESPRVASKVGCGAFGRDSAAATSSAAASGAGAGAGAGGGAGAGAFGGASGARPPRGLDKARRGAPAFAVGECPLAR